MTVYSVSGKLAVLGLSEEAALAVLQEKASVCEMDLANGRSIPMSDAPSHGYFATGLLAGLFEAETEKAAMARFMKRVLSRTGILPSSVMAFVSEDVPEEWVR
jgi:hypothetical protein